MPSWSLFLFSTLKRDWNLVKHSLDGGQAGWPDERMGGWMDGYYDEGGGKNQCRSQLRGYQIGVIWEHLKSIKGTRTLI